MNEQLQEMVDYTREKFGLDNYHLQRHHFFRETDNFNETAYILNMEWFPNSGEQADEALNPVGTAVVDINFHSKAIKRIVFVQDVTYAGGNPYPSSDKESVIEWIEELTGLTFGRQFLIVHEEDEALSFGAAVDNIPVAPTGTIEIEFNDDGQLTMFSIDGNFPNEHQIQWEPFALTTDKFESLAKEQCKRINTPDEEHELWVPVYGIEEIYITNDGEHTIPFGEDLATYIDKNIIMEWNKPIEGEFLQKDIDLSPEVTLEEVMANKAHPDTFPITDEEQNACEEEVLRFLQLVYPAGNGQKKLTGLYPKDGYIIAEIRPIDSIYHGMDLKIKLLIERERLTAVHYVDQDMLLESFSNFQTPDTPTISQSEAFEKLRDYIEIEPVYVYDNKQDSYVMCGKLDCAYGVNAVTGEVGLLGGL